MSDLVPATSAPKHKCLPSEACIIHLSDIGRCFHTFPKGMFNAQFTPPALPLFVARYCAAHPLYWQWTTKGGPNAGKTFKVPTVPTHCSKGSPKAISWLVNAFHSFKAHLTPSVLVPKPLLQIYQSNMVLHLRAQLHAHSSSDTTPPSLQPVAPGAAPSTLNPEKAVLRSQAMSPPPSAHPTSDDTSLVESLKALYASAISQVAALEVELVVFRSNPQAPSAHSIPSVGTSLTSATPSILSQLLQALFLLQSNPHACNLTYWLHPPYHLTYSSAFPPARIWKWHQPVTPKLKLYGLFRALHHYHLYLYGVKHLFIEVDAKLKVSSCLTLNPFMFLPYIIKDLMHSLTISQQKKNMKKASKMLKKR
ncbi:hypothetical protein BU15DRAFT_79321 [Melanogaster broomeanus]|nr:hypothetical protein BU15DRAFT_79321 [Melanogaster broomeanus]